MIIHGSLRAMVSYGFYKHGVPHTHKTFRHTENKSIGTKIQVKSKLIYINAYSSIGLHPSDQGES